MNRTVEQAATAEPLNPVVPVPSAQTGPGTRGGWAEGWSEALHAEWTKLRTLPGTFWLVAAIAALTFAVGAAASGTATCPTADCGQDPAKIALTGVDLGQAVVAILAVLMVSGEYSTGMIHITFAAMPRRTLVLAAKAASLTGLTLVAGAIAVCGSVLTATSIMPGRGFTTAHGYPPSTFTDATMLRAASGSVLYLALIGLLSLGVATLVRDSAAGVGITLGLLYLSPIVAGVVTDPTWHNRIERYSPMNAGTAIEATRDLASMPIGPWEGLGVLAVWTAAALLTGGIALHMRDA
jgi:ABC-2 type transport system permease protein